MDDFFFFFIYFKRIDNQRLLIKVNEFQIIKYDPIMILLNY